MNNKIYSLWIEDNRNILGDVMDVEIDDYLYKMLTDPKSIYEFLDKEKILAALKERGFVPK